MLLFFSVLGVLCWWLILLFSWRPWSTEEHIEAHGCNIGRESLQDITVLIPARNEGFHISRTLSSVRTQDEQIRVIVVDDQSTDDTAEQARRFGATIVTGTTPPEGWSGKLWALEQGLAEVETSYTLLLDADIELTPGIVAELRRKLRDEHLTMVSLMAQPPMESLTERLLMPAFIFFFKLLYPFALVAKSESRTAAAAGGCILVETQVLRAIGAFACLHDALIDDCTLAAHIKHSGHCIFLGLSRDARSHRSYHEIRPIWEMVARTAYTQLKYSPWLLAACTLIMVAMFIAAPFAFLVSSSPMLDLVSTLSWIAMFTAYSPTLTYYQRSPLWSFALPAIGALYLAMTWTSAVRYWRGERASWKERRYENKTNH
ncbi:MAG: glycosyltransferase [Nitrosomonas sp.]|nr:MAG: glycosyltransferase [Nitrosomonas sp.]